MQFLCELLHAMSSVLTFGEYTANVSPDENQSWVSVRTVNLIFHTLVWIAGQVASKKQESGLGILNFTEVRILNSENGSKELIFEASEKS